MTGNTAADTGAESEGLLAALDQANIETLRKELTGSHLERRLKAVDALAAVGTPPAVSLLALAVREADLMTAARAAHLAQRGRLREVVPAVIERIEKLTPDDDHTNTALLLHVLALLPDPAATPALSRFVASRNRHV